MIYIIAEIGINHNGDMGIAKDLIKIAAKAGCDAVKFQKRTIDLVYTEEELAKPRESPWGTTTRHQKEGLEFDMVQHEELYELAKSLDLDYIISCWDVNSVVDVEQYINVDYHKVASALITNYKLLDKINETYKPVILSTGMSTDEEIKLAITHLDRVTGILACTSTYPTSPEEVNLRHIDHLITTYPHLDIGFSNHYSGGLACYGAVALGAKIIEFHITKDRTMYGSDHAASIKHVDVVVDGIRIMEAMLGDGAKVVYESEKPILKKLRR